MAPAPAYVSTLHTWSGSSHPSCSSDLVDSTGLVAGTDPEVVRRRVTKYFDMVSQCVEQHGGIVEKFAGDAVMAAFGVPQAHEDDAQRATRAALAICDAVERARARGAHRNRGGRGRRREHLRLDLRDGRGGQPRRPLAGSGPPGEILIGTDRVPPRCRQPRRRGCRPARAQGHRRAATRVARHGHARRPSPTGWTSRSLVGRESELELLENTFNRSLRDKRAHLFTIYGEAGVGKSRLARESSTGSSGRACSWAAPFRTARASPTGRSARWSRQRPGSPTTIRWRRRSRNSANAAPRRQWPTFSASRQGSWRHSTENAARRRSRGAPVR